ncbi:addiction module protein [Allorhodopirellula solitaria]|uniref:addiction module protein n=1 Tax=Allorhodopirellula solitaria TaxID=2527987 RepID=UPI0011B787EC|nr:addiction module protein [Allorhodopirellula solitaria]
MSIIRSLGASPAITASCTAASVRKIGSSDIGASDEPIVLQPWQREEAQRRSAELKADPSIAIDRDEMWRHVDG